MDKKFCESCGNALVEGDAFCNSCGAAVDQTPGPYVENDFSQSLQHQQMGAGILLFAAVSAALALAVLYWYGSIIPARFQSLMDSLGSIFMLWNFVFLTSELVAIGGAAFLIMSVVQSVNRNTSFLRTLQIGLILILAAPVVADIAGLFLAYAFHDGVDTSLYLRVTIESYVDVKSLRGLLFVTTFWGSLAALFLLPLCYSKSKEVHAYMGGDGYTREALFIIGR